MFEAFKGCNVGLSVGVLIWNIIVCVLDVEYFSVDIGDGKRCNNGKIDNKLETKIISTMINSKHEPILCLKLDIS